jgi:hypothetical protein
MTDRSTRAPMRALAIAALTVPFAAVPADANPLGVPTRIADFPPAYITSEDPAIAAGDGRLLVVYERTRVFDAQVERLGLQGEEVVAQLVDPSGAPIGDPVLVDDDDLGTQGDPDVAYNATRDEFYVVWKRDDIFNSARAFFGELIRGRRVSGDGQPVGDVVDLGGQEPEDPKVAWSETEDEYLAVWDDDSDDEVYGREVDGDGTPGDAEISLTADGVDDAEDPAVAHDPETGQWLVAYEADGLEQPGRGSAGFGVYAQLFDGDAEPATDDPFAIDAANEHYASSPDVEPRGADGGFRVAYSAASEEEEAREIYTRDVAGDGAVATEADQASPSNTDDQPFGDSVEPSIARDTVSGEYLVAWHFTGFFDGNRSLAPNNAIAGRRQSAAGDMLGDGEASISDQALLGDGTFATNDVVTAYDRKGCQFTTAWEGDAPLADAQTRISAITTREEVFTRGFDAPDCPTEEQKAAQAATAAAGQGAAAQSTTQTFGRPPHRCLSRRNFTATVRIGKGLSFRSHSVSLAGEGLDVESQGRTLRIPVDLRGKAPGVYVLRVTARLSNGRTLRVTRRYRACAVGRTTRLVRVDP